MIDRIEMTIPEMIDSLNWENGSNFKIAQLKSFVGTPNEELLKTVLKMTYDKVAFTYGISLGSIGVITNDLGKIPFETAVGMLNKLVSRTYTGNAARDYLTNILNSVDEVEARVIKGIINRDQRINMGRHNINKVWKNLIVLPPYMRCGIYGEKTSKKISFPALVQLKADGRFCAVTVDQGEVTFSARSGEVAEFPNLEKRFKNFPDGVYIGELTVQGITDRSKGNGMINSDEPPHDKIQIDLWDFVTLDEYSRGKDKKNKTPYVKRLNQLEKNITQDSLVAVITTYEVSSLPEALKYTSEWMTSGFEGAILKDESNIFVDHTSPTQLKLKLEIDAEVRITGFTEGTKGTKREKTFGAMQFENDEGTIKGQTSGFNDAQLEDFNSRREELIGKVITVQFNDLSKAEGNDYYAFSHPRFIEIRDDKNETDTIERVFELREMATTLGGK